VQSPLPRLAFWTLQPTRIAATGLPALRARPAPWSARATEAIILPMSRTAETGSYDPVVYGRHSYRHQLLLVGLPAILDGPHP
jgi:hypothetical protein